VDGLKQEMEALYARIRRLQEQRKKADAKQLAATYKIMQAEEKALSNHIANLEPAYMPDTLAGPVDPVSSIEVTPDEMAGELNVRRPPVARALCPSPLAPRPSAPHPSPRALALASFAGPGAYCARRRSRSDGLSQPPPPPPPHTHLHSHTLCLYTRPG